LKFEALRWSENINGAEGADSFLYAAIDRILIG
jgi:hypothetical protein